MFIQYKKIKTNHCCLNAFLPKRSENNHEEAEKTEADARIGH